MTPCHAGMAAECRGVSEGGAGQHGGERQLHFGKEHTLPAHTLPAHTLPAHTLPAHTLPAHTLPATRPEHI